jgi:membrane dipeptidase
MMEAIAVFDGHNDLLSCLHREDDAAARGFFEGRKGGHIDLAKMQAGGVAGGLFAVWPSCAPGTAPDPMAMARHFPEIDDAPARRDTIAQLAIFSKLTRSWPDVIRACRSAQDIREARSAGAIAAVLHLEGAEAISPDLEELHLFHAAGLRSLGPVWSRTNIFGNGVPFVFPASPDTGPGLTDVGRRLVVECDALGILVDLAHLNEAGFWDVAAISARPLISTHSAAHALTPATRNLTDRQLKAMAERGGLVGLNFGCAFVRPDGIKNADTAPEVLIRHLDHLLSILGESGVALGSDFDGTLVPDFLSDASGMPLLIAAMERAGYGEALIRRICWDNWIAMLERVIG